LYLNSGFTEIKQIKPDYWFYDKKNKICFSKKVRYRDNLVRIYDCGKTKFRFSLQ